jgi:hypothetical protein
MNKNLVIGVVVAISLLLLIQFPDDTITLIKNIGSVLGEIWDAIRGLLREFI